MCKTSWLEKILFSVPSYPIEIRLTKAIFLDMRGKGLILRLETVILLCDAPIQPEYLSCVFLKFLNKRENNS